MSDHEGVMVYGHVPECHVTFGRGRLYNVWWDPHIDHKTSWGTISNVPWHGCRSLSFFDLKFRGIHLTEVIFKVRVIYGQCVIDVSICEVELRCQPFPTGREQGLGCMNSASYVYRHMSARRGAQFVPMGMPIICWKTLPAKTTKMLSTRNASILMMSSSVYLLFESVCSLTK